MQAKDKNTNKKGIYAIISLLLLGVIIFQLYINRSKWSEVSLAWQALQAASPLWIGVAIIAAPLGWLIESKKWQYMTQKFAPASFLQSFSSVMTGMSFAFVSPGKVGDFAGRALYFQAHERWRAIISVIISNMAQTLVTLFMGFLGAMILVQYGGLWWQWLILGISLLILVLFGWLYFRIHRISFGRYAQRRWLRQVRVALYVLKKYQLRDLAIICLFSLAKFVVYTTQFLIIAHLLGAVFPLITAFFIACVMFWMITVIPSFFVADIVLRGNIAHLLFIVSGISTSVVPILSASYLLWVINWILPSLIGAFTLMVFRRKKGSVSKK